MGVTALRLGADAAPTVRPGLVRSMTVTGGAQAVTLVLSLVRMKAVALLLGPSGVALVAVYADIVATAVVLAGFGLRTSAVRDLAAAADDPLAFARVRCVLVWGHGLLAVPAAAVLWLAREPLAAAMLGDPGRAPAVGVLGIAVVFALAASARHALLQGSRRVDDLARATVWGAAGGTVAGLAALLALEDAGPVAFVVVQPLASLLAVAVYAGRLPRGAGRAIGAGEAWRTFAAMARLGGVLMASGLLSTGALLLVRALIVRGEGLEAAGHFTAAWALATQAVGFLLAAMSVDYYPRLSAAMGDGKAARRLVREQSRLGLLIGGPVLVAFAGLAPMAVALLYSEAFAPAVPVLQAMLLGTVLKLAAWPLGFALVAAGRAGAFFSAELLWNGIFVAAVVVGLPAVGLGVTGWAVVGAYAVYHAALLLLVRLGPSPVGAGGLVLAYGGAVLGVMMVGWFVSALAAVAAGFCAAAVGAAVSVRALRPSWTSPAERLLRRAGGERRVVHG